MAGLFALSSAAVRLSAAAFAALSLIGAAAPARAEGEDEWVLVVTERNGDQWFVHAPSVGRKGGFVSSSISFEPKKRAKAPVSRRRYEYAVIEQIDDCAARKFALINFAYRDGNDEDVEQRDVPADQVVFAQVAPGSVGEMISGFACKLADKVVPERAAIPMEGVEAADWTLVMPDAGDGRSAAVLTASAEREGALARVVARLDYAAGDKLADGRRYQTMVSTLFFNCTTPHYVAKTTDYYAFSGALIEVETASDDAVPVEPGDVVEDARAFACAVASGTSTGTGWLAAQGYIVTASHVVTGAERIQIFQEGRRLGDAEVVRDDPVNDVAVLKPLFDTARHAALRISTSPAALGQRVFTLGYPLADDLGAGAVKMTAGDVSSLAGVDVDTGRVDDRRFLQVSIPVQGGNSGGPVIGPDGSVVGLILAKMQATDDEIVQNVNFALKAGYVTSLMDALPRVGAAKPAVARGDTAAVVAGVQSGVFLIVAGPRAAERQAER